MTSPADELAFRQAVFEWLGERGRDTGVVTREQLAAFPMRGELHRLVGPQTGIWKVKRISEAAISIVTAYTPDGLQRPYEDSVGVDGFLRYKWRGTDPNHADNRALRLAMRQELPLVWFVGIGYVPGTKTQVFEPRFPVWLVDEEPHLHQFVVSVDEDQRRIPLGADATVIDITRRYNERLVKVRYHQPLFRSVVLHAYERRCAVCRLPFAELLDAAHIRPDAADGAARVSNGLSLCKIHHGAFDANIIGITPDYVVRVKDSVLKTFDGPTLQHSIKEMDGERLRQLPRARAERPDKELLAERFDAFERAG